MVKKIISFALSIVVIILSLALLKNPEILENSEKVFENVDSEYEFLSNEYFDELDELFKKVKVDNDKWYIFDGSKKIAAKIVINQMMYDLEKKPNDLSNHDNFTRFLDTFDKNIRKLDSITEKMHFFRNTLNTYSDAPTKFDDMLNLAARGKWKLFSAKFHRFNYEEINGALNVKFVSADGRFEAVYNTGTGEIVLDAANMGTYNYAPGSMNPIKYYMHNKYDKKPWKRWGNIKGTPYRDIISLKSENGSDDAENNSKEVEKLIKQRKVMMSKP
jgi:hypothetical protein